MRPSPPRPREHRLPTTPSCRVLVVDDCRQMAQGLAALVSLWGHHAQVAHDGPAALRLAGEYRPQVVLLDLNLPGLSGHAVARQLRRDPGLAGTLLVALTGHAEEEDRRGSHEAGIDVHLVKPVDLDRLKEVLAAR